MGPYGNIKDKQVQDWYFREWFTKHCMSRQQPENLVWYLSRPQQQELSEIGKLKTVAHAISKLMRMRHNHSQKPAPQQHRAGQPTVQTFRGSAWSAPSGYKHVY